ncbi:hypothetical protein FXV77_21360 [Sphingobacterium phlebotomi]|uniref:Uncharacterized protein n=1 Tax=Sphingobacterium phlebotomi TaxID=2605433 RepID=A0A5D4GSZ8_9SPHI|nr:hypothetical protein [Sphingobacterium phlebotomi]TYR31244.1 hypothetical protein FXV77_21360 [Sphingobacterium phlebotomi]
MERQPILDFFDISSNVEELPRNELFRLRGGYSDGTIDGGELPGVDVPPPPGSPDPDDDPWDWGGDDPHDGWEDDNSDSGGWSDTGGGSGGGGGSISTPPPANDDSSNDEDDTENNDPWERDENGNIIGAKTGYEFLNDDYLITLEDGTKSGVILNLAEVKLQANGVEITVYEVQSVIDAEPNTPVRAPIESEKSNCFGYAVGDGQYWFEDNPSTSNNEFSEFSKFVNAFYEPCSASEASLVVLDHGGPYHAGRVYHDSNGNITYASKDGVGGVQIGYSESAFRGTSHIDGTAIYYKLKD